MGKKIDHIQKWFFYVLAWHTAWTLGMGFAELVSFQINTVLCKKEAASGTQLKVMIVND
jgi:hypothetical protein